MLGFIFIIVMVSVYLLLDPILYRKVIGLVLLGNVINLILLISGRGISIYPAFINSSRPDIFSNPLPQALVLTAIVIGFGLFSLLATILRVVSSRTEKKKHAKH